MLPPRIGSRDGRVEACGVSRGALLCSMRIGHKGLRALHERDNPARGACGTGATASAHPVPAARGDASANMALALEDIGWGTAEHWMRLQASYELAQARRDRTTAERRMRALHA